MPLILNVYRGPLWSVGVRRGPWGYVGVPWGFHRGSTGSLCVCQGPQGSFIVQCLGQKNVCRGSVGVHRDPLGYVGVRVGMWGLPGGLWGFHGWSVGSPCGGGGSLGGTSGVIHCAMPRLERLFILAK